MVKSAREAGTLLRKIVKFPYWKEVWVTKRELKEFPKRIAKEAQLDETRRELNKETLRKQSMVTSSIADLIHEVDQTEKSNHQDARIGLE